MSHYQFAKYLRRLKVRVCEHCANTGVTKLYEVWIVCQVCNGNSCPIPLRELCGSQMGLVDYINKHDHGI